VAVTTPVSLAAPAGQVPYRTDAHAEHYLEHGLKRWAGIDLKKAGDKFASCIDGYYSRHEQRTGKHFPQGHTNRYGEDTFRSFGCTLTVGARSFHLYVVTRVHGWRVIADR
jgi:hypothetical protein